MIVNIYPKNKKRVISWTFISVIVISLVVSGCRNEPRDNKRDAMSEAQLKEKYEREYAVRQDSLVEVIKTLQSKTNFTDPAANQQRDSLVKDLTKVVRSYEQLLGKIKNVDPTGKDARDKLNEIIDEGDKVLEKYTQYREDSDRFAQLTEGYERRIDSYKGQIRSQDSLIANEIGKFKKQAENLLKQIVDLQAEVAVLKNKNQTLEQSNMRAEAKALGLQSEIDSRNKHITELEKSYNEITDVVPQMLDFQIHSINDKPMRLKKGGVYPSKKIESLSLQIEATQIKPGGAIDVYIYYYLQPKTGTAKDLGNVETVELEGHKLNYTKKVHITRGGKSPASFELALFRGIAGTHHIQIYYNSSSMTDEFTFETY